MNGYSPRQLVSYYRYCRANPEGHVLPPGGQRHWDDMPAAKWLSWFRACPMTKCSRGTGGALFQFGKGSGAKRRAAKLLDGRAECKWCGQKTGAAGRKFCCVDCQRAYYF